MEVTPIEIIEKVKKGFWERNKGVKNLEKCGICREKSSPYNAANCRSLAAPF
jgi:hypothetical protein